MKEVIMIKKYVYGTPFDTESVVEQLPASDGVPSYGAITTEKGFAFSPVLFLCSHDMRHKTAHLLRRLLLHQQIHRFLGDGDFSGIGRCLGPSHLDPAALDAPLGYQQCFALHLQIAPEQGGQFAFPQAADSFHKEHREHPAGICLP